MKNNIAQICGCPDFLHQWKILMGKTTLLGSACLHPTNSKECMAALHEQLRGRILGHKWLDTEERQQGTIQSTISQYKENAAKVFSFLRFFWAFWKSHVERESELLLPSLVWKCLYTPVSWSFLLLTQNQHADQESQNSLSAYLSWSNESKY